ncbi:hypothetical protein NIES2101_42880 [Calothrix sp. HK-06]|nr:hypothetical protein NIES2101_42880 [Calothrix sp. HK-06]
MAVPTTQHLTRTPLFGKEAFKAFINLGFQRDDTIWLKFGHNRFFKGTVTLDGNVEISATRGIDENRRLTNECYIDGYKYLALLASGNDGGMFYIPGKPTENPLKKYCTASNDVGAEMDDGTGEEQWQCMERFSQNSEIIFLFIVSSGGKSYHPHLGLSQTVPIAQWQFYSRMLAISLIADPAVCSPHQPMRAPGFFRKEKGKEQALEFYNDKKYTPTELEAGFQRYFEALGMVWRPQAEFSEVRWSEVRNVLASKTLTRLEKEAKVREILSLLEAELPANKRNQELEERHQQKQQNKVTNLNGFDLIELVEQGSEKLGADAFLNWAGQTFTWSGSKARGNCPFHESTTGTAGWIAPHINKPGQFGFACPTCTNNKQINAFTFWLYLKHGLNAPFPDGKQYVDAAKEFLNFAGITIPDNYENNYKNSYKTETPDVKFYADYVAWEKYQSETEELIAEEQSKQKILDILTKLRAKVRDFTKLFDKEPKTKTTPKPTTLIYNTGNLPTPEKYKSLKNPKIVFKAEHRHQIWAEAIDKGYKNILDNSHTGAGKSHAIGEFKYEQCSQQFYLAADHRNPTTKTIQDNYVDLVVRHNGLKYDDTRKTPNGKDFLVWPKAGERPDTYSNCPRQPIFSVLASKNIDEEGKHGAVCQTCSLANICKNSGYKSQRRQVLERKHIRAHPDSLPRVSNAKAYEDEENILDYSNSIMFWDEVERLLKTSQTITVKLPDLDQVMGMIENANTELFNALQSLRKAIRSFFNGDVERKRYGYDDKAFKALLPNQEEFIEHITKFGFDGASLIETLLGILKPDLSFLKEEENRLNRDDSNRASKATEKFVDQVLRKETRKEMHEAAKDLPLNWLPTFLLILYYGQSGAFTFNWDKLTVHSKSNTHLDLVREAKTNIFIDATLSRRLLALKLKIKQSEILLIEEEKPNYSNLTIIQITGMGKLGRQRASGMIEERIPALKAYLRAKHKDDIAFFDHKLFAGPEDGYHFRDNRGVNRFEGTSALASIGIPCSNLGALKVEFQLLYGYCPDEEKDKNFKAFVDEKTNGETIQDCGRLRANRTDAQKTYYSIADYDISFLALAFPGATIKTQHISEICIEAANGGDKTISIVLNAIKQVMLGGCKLTQQAVSQAAKVTQGAVSKIISKLGGWGKLKKLFQVLLDSFNSRWNNLKNLDEDMIWVATQWFPELVAPPDSEPDPENVVTEVMNTAKAYGLKKFKAILANCTKQTRVGILTCFIQILPDYVLSQFLDIMLERASELIEGF